MDCEDARKTTPLMAACFKGRADAVDVLLHLGADVTRSNSYGETCVHNACKEGHIDVLEVLSKHGVDLETGGNYGRTPFMYACQYGKTDVIDFLLMECRVRVLDVDENDANGLHLCCMGTTDNRAVARKLICFGMHVNTQDRNGMTAIMHACFHGNELMFDFLYSKGANITLQDRYRKTCLDFAMRKGHHELADKIRQCVLRSGR